MGIKDMRSTKAGEGPRVKIFRYQELQRVGVKRNTDGVGAT